MDRVQTWVCLRIKLKSSDSLAVATVRNCISVIISKGHRGRRPGKFTRLILG